MRFMVLVKASQECEAGVLPSQELLAAMGRYNEKLADAGVLLALEGLQPSSKGARVRFTDGAPIVTDGPFAELKELVGGFWLWQVGSKAEAIEWLKQAPFGPGMEVELRRVYEPEDFAARMTPEMKESSERLCAQVAAGR